MISILIVHNIEMLKGEMLIMLENKFIYTNIESVEEFEDAMEEYEKMLKEFEEDKKIYDFSIPQECDEDFRKAMDEVLEKKTTEINGKLICRRKMIQNSMYRLRIHC